MLQRLTGVVQCVGHGWRLADDVRALFLDLLEDLLELYTISLDRKI